MKIEKYYYLLLIPITSFLIVFGVGFWYMDHLEKLEIQTAKEIANQPHPFIYKKDPNSLEELKKTINSALKKNHEATSFHLKVTEQHPDQTIIMQIAYNKPLRLKLNITKDKEILQTIIVGPSIYILDNKQWKITQNKDLSNFSKNFFTFQASTDVNLTDWGVPKDVNKIKKTKNIIKKCTEYKTEYTNKNTTNKISFCIDKNNQIKFIKKETKDGFLLQEFSDYNQPFIIERPSIPVLDPTPHFKVIKNED